ncbi:mucin-13b isoform X3 [Garra rufa]|uniref:mucin-13b isoform X3 n=1 Tax=Garra rufa TaxID=137080 RepID=UPI003CCEC0A1
MNIPLKTLLIFCLMAEMTAQSSTAIPSITTTAAAATTTAIDSTAVPSSATTAVAATTTTIGSTSVPNTTPASTPATTVTTEATGTTATGTTATGTTGTTDGSTAATPISATTMTQAPEGTSSGTFNTVTTAYSTGGTPVSTAASTTTTTTQGPCASRPCIGDSACEERFGGLFACICRPGLFYLEMRGCIQTKVFPGRLSLDRTFLPDMGNKNSLLFQQTAGEIEEVFRSILGDDNGYINSTVLSLRQGSIIAEVQNFYDLSSDATLESVNEMIANESDGIANFTSFNARSVCEAEFCDFTTTNCDERVPGIATCNCQKGYIKSEFTSQACLACPNGERATDNSEECVRCPFGFAGFNCNDPYLLIVVVVSTVLGALLIIFIVALIVVSCRNQKGSSSSQVDFSSSYGNKELHKPTGVPRIPRANPDANNLEMTDSGSNQALVTRDRPESKARYNDYEDLGYRDQIPPAYSGYGGRGVENGGAHNPYFRQDDDKIRRY